MTLADVILIVVPILAAVLWALAVVWLRARRPPRAPGYRTSHGRHLTYRDGE